MGIHKWTDIKNKNKSPERIARLDREVKAELVEMSLRELREGLGITQQDLAKAGEVQQSEVSRVERRDDLLLSTLRRYIEGPGGELEICAVVGDKRVRLRGV